MIFKDAIRHCHVRSGIRRIAKPDKIYWYNHSILLEDRVSIEEQKHNDWKEYDPREYEECSAYNEMPA